MGDFCFKLAYRFFGFLIFNLVLMIIKIALLQFFMSMVFYQLGERERENEVVDFRWVIQGLERRYVDLGDEVHLQHH